MKLRSFDAKLRSFDAKLRSFVQIIPYSFNGNSAPCLGPTGLMPGETDTTEDAGCTDPDDNNFLAPMELLAGETYVLCIQNYSDFNGFIVDFYGSAAFVCDTFQTPTATHNPEYIGFTLHNLYPNPVATPFLLLDMETATTEQMAFTLVNVLGQPVRKIQRTVPAGRQTQEIPVDHLPAGTYWLQITNGRAVTARQIWIEGTSD